VDGARGPSGLQPQGSVLGPPPLVTYDRTVA
jgi:hypothetical protein